MVKPVGRKGRTVRKAVSFKRRSMEIFCLLLLPIVICLLVYDVYVIDEVMRTNVARNYQMRMETMLRTIDEKLENVGDYMTSLMVSGTDFSVLQYEASRRELFDSTQNILASYQYVLNVNREITGFLLYSSVNDYYRILENLDAGYIHSAEMRDYAAEVLQSGQPNVSGWYQDTIGGRRYAVRLTGRQRAVQMCFVDIEKLEKSLHEELAPDETLSILVSEGENAGQTYDFTVEGGQRKIVLKQECCFASVVMTARYAVNLSAGQRAFIAVSFVFLLAMLPLGVWAYSRMLMRPIARLTGAMGEVKDGNLNAKISYAGDIYEYQKMSDTFNDMLDQVQSLKILSYERTMEVQRIELQYLHLQIRPHFYLNCLKILYGLAQMKDYERIQKLLLLLSEYLRGILDSRSMIPLEEELRHVSTYVSLCGMIGSAVVRYEQKVEADIEEFMIPSLTLLTFVENSIKHGQIPGRPLSIVIQVKRFGMEEGEFLNLSVSDDGAGFDQDTLKILNGSETQPDAQNGRNVGISNIRERLSLTYGGRASVSFLNMGGARVELFIPFKTYLEEIHDRTDC